MPPFSPAAQATAIDRPPADAHDTAVGARDFPFPMDAMTANEHFRAIVQSSDDAIISKTLAGVITSWNRGATDLFGYTEQEMLGQTLLRLLPEGRELEEQLILERIGQGEKVDHFETVRRHQSGRLIHVSVTISPLHDGEGRVIGASKVARDISAQVALQQATQHLGAIVAASDDAIVSKTLDGTVQTWNLAAERIFGYTAQEMIGQPIQRLFPPERVDEEAHIVQRLLAGERVDHFETVRVRKDGRRIDVAVTISPVYDAAGRVVGASKIAQDISLRKQAQQRMELLGSVFTHTTEAILITDDEGVILEVNDAFIAITGYGRSDVLGHDPGLFRSGRQGPEVYRAMLASLQETGHCDGEVWSRRKTGEAYAVMLTVSCVPDPSGGRNKYVALFSDITSLREQQEQMERLANFDPLTHLPNRLLLSDRLKRAMAHTQRSEQTLAVVYLDLDGFKAVNDQHGHDVGDELLIALSGRMLAAIRESDTLARIGGDEFVVVLSDVGSMLDCRRALDRILAACHEPVLIHGLFTQVSASMGVTLYPQDDSDTDQLLRHADQAMYEAKQLGKNRFHLFDARKDAEIKTRSEKINRLSSALSNQEFVLHFQPKVNLRTGAVTGAEALIRWQHPEQGLLAPGEFLPLIEGHALIEAVGEWVIDAALQQLAQWKAEGLDFTLSINIAARQLQAENFATHLMAQVALFPTLIPAQLELEIVESSALEDTDTVSTLMLRCQALGFRFAVDDFGTGYSSLTYLKRLQIDTIKIDQSFIRDMLDDPDDLAIVKGVIGLAKAFNREVIAEGVESLAHGQRLLELGCELVQGYGIARPMPAEQLVPWIHRWRQGGNPWSVP